MFADLTLRTQCKLAVLAVALTLSNGASATRAQGENPSSVLISNRAVAFNPSTGKLYAVDERNGAVSVIDGRTNSSISVKVGSGPDALAVNKITGNVYIANASDGTVSALDGVTNSVTATFKAGSHPYILAVNEATNKVYVSNTFSDAVAEINIAAGTTRFLKIGSADNIAIDSHRSRIFLIGYEDPNIRIMNGSTNVVERVAAHEHLWGMALNEVTGKLYVTDAGNADLFAVDTASGKRTRIPVGAIPCAVAVNAQGDQVYVVNYGDDTVTVIDGKTENSIATLEVGSGPQAIAVDSRSNRVYVANTHGNSVTIIDGQNNSVIDSVPAGKNPYAITVGPDSRTVYVANFGEPSFTVVPVGKK